MKRACVVAAGLALTMSCFANDGAVDTSFNSPHSGIARAGLTAVTSFSFGSALQHDGKIVMAGTIDSGGPSGIDTVVVRWNADGTLDNTFNFSGIRTIDIDGGGMGNSETATSIALTPDDKIVVVGTVNFNGNTDMYALRLNANGTLDNTFNSTGKTIIAFDLGGTNDDGANSVAVQSDGKIVIAGYATTAANNYDFAVVRLATDGTRDSAFNLTGREVIPFDLGGDLGDGANSVLIDSENRIVVAGYAHKLGSSADFAILRLLPNGQLDPDFFSGGKETIAFDLGASNSEIAYKVLQQADGRLLLLGQTDTGLGATNNVDMAVARLNPDGGLDTHYGNGGLVTLPFDLATNGADIGASGAVQWDGKLVLAGYAAYINSPTTLKIGVARLDTDGSLDSGFGSAGKTALDFGLITPGNQIGTGVLIQDGQIVVTGAANVIDSNHVDLIATRLRNDYLFANGFD